MRSSLQMHQPVAGVVADGEERLRVVHGAPIGALEQAFGGTPECVELIGYAAQLVLAEAPRRRARAETGSSGAKALGSAHSTMARPSRTRGIIAQVQEAVDRLPDRAARAPSAGFQRRRR